MEAHQQALTVEAQCRNNSVPWTTNRQTHQNQAASASTTTESASLKPETAFVSSDPSRQKRTWGLHCFSCGEAGPRQAACPQRSKRGLLTEEVSDTEEPVYGDDEPDAEEELYPYTCNLLIVRLSCLTPHADDHFPQWNKIFQSCCTINGKVCSFVIDSGSSKNVIAADAVTNLDIKDEPHPPPYKLAWLQQTHDLYKHL